VWACGLAVVDGHLVVVVEAPGYPEARVIALPSPDAAPVAIMVHATAADPAGLPTWEIDDLGRERHRRIGINRT
jgi:hypothetical protein